MPGVVPNAEALDTTLRSLFTYEDKMRKTVSAPLRSAEKNWLFPDGSKGVEASAEICTLVETAKANGLALMKYIKYILSDMPGSAFFEYPEYLDDYLLWDPLVKEFCR